MAISRNQTAPTSTSREVRDAARRLTSVTRETAALQRRLRGDSYAAIATDLGFADRSGARKACQRAVRRQGVDSEEYLRLLEFARLEQLNAAIWATAMAGDPKAIEAALKLSNRRVKLLGLDLPTTATNEAGRDSADIVAIDADVLHDLLVDFGRRAGLEVTPETNMHAVAALCAANP
jgi:hypothetical protein